MKKSKGIFLKVVSVYEVLGGLAGVFLMLFLILPALFKKSYHSGIEFIYFFTFAFLILFILSIVAGLFLWMNKNIGYLLSFIVQLFQLPYIITSSFIYVFISGLNFAPYIASKGIGLSFYVGGSFLFYLGYTIPSFRLGINLVALFLVAYVLISWRKKAVDFS